MATATAKRGIFKKLWTSIRKMPDSSDEEEYIGPLEPMYAEEKDLMGASSMRGSMRYSSRRRGSQEFEEDASEEPPAPTEILVTCDNIEHETEWEAIDTICLDHLRLTPDILQWVSTNCSPTLQEIRFLPNCVFLEEGQEALQTLLKHATLNKVVFEGLSWTFFQALEAVLKSKKSTCNVTQVDLWIHETRQCAVVSSVLPKLTHVRLRGPDLPGPKKGMDFCCSPSKIDWTRAKKLRCLSLVTTNLELLSVLHQLPKTLRTLDLSHSSLQLPEVLDALTEYLSSPDCALRELVRNPSHQMAGEEICRILQSGHSLKVLDLKGCAMISLADLVRVCRLLEFNHTLERLDITPASIRSNQLLYKPYELEAAQESIRMSLEANLTLRWFLCKGLRFHDMTFFGSGQRF